MDSECNTSQLLLKNIPNKLREDFKAACRKNKVHMYEAFLKFMESYPDLKTPIVPDTDHSPANHMLVQNISKEARTEFNIACLRKDTHMRPVLIGFMQQYVRQYGGA